MKDKRLEKIKKHFTISCNGHNVNILKYKKTDDGTLEIITKIDNINLFTDDVIVIKINENEQHHVFKLHPKTKFSDVSVFHYYYEILSEECENIQTDN